MEEQVEYKAKKAKKKVVRYEYFCSYADRNNKLQNIIADLEYLVNTNDNVVRLCQDIKTATNDNFKAIYCFQMMRKKYITVDEKNETK